MSEKLTIPSKLQNTDIVVRVDGVGKKFCKSLKNSMLYGAGDIIKSSFGMNTNPDKLRKDEFWALDDVSFELKKGEALGIIGPNGSGKTTLLKMLNGIFMPDKGKIEMKGKVGALIELGAGFHSMLTGRENIYINGAILGMSKKEINEKFDSIVEFADIGDFLDAPVKHYSSGMFVRLGFAIAIHSEPDVLLIDEILAVGDNDFQIKCCQKMYQLRQKGISIILVSHYEYAIRNRTTNCLYLKNGKSKFLGHSEEAISVYIKETLEDRAKKNIIEDKGGTNRLQSAKKAELISLKFFDKDWNEISFIESGQEINITIECLIKEELENTIVGVNFYDENNFVYCINSYYEKANIEKYLQGKIKAKINIPRFHLPVNNYLCSIIIAEGNVDNLIDWQNIAYKLVVGRAKDSWGSIKLETKWEVERL
ncbi:MAG: ABC transporter ATP-binding protein [bacterium]|nr:ABC transporter ATP-binding protein [bacterium]